MAPMKLGSIETAKCVPLIASWPMRTTVRHVLETERINCHHNYAAKEYSPR